MTFSDDSEYTVGIAKPNSIDIAIIFYSNNLFANVSAMQTLHGQKYFTFFLQLCGGQKSGTKIDIQPLNSGPELTRLKGLSCKILLL